MDDNDIDLALRLGDPAHSPGREDQQHRQPDQNSEDVQSLLPAVPADWTPGEAGEVIQVFIACFLGRLEHAAPGSQLLCHARRQLGNAASVSCAPPEARTSSLTVMPDYRAMSA